MSKIKGMETKSSYSYGFGASYYEQGYNGHFFENLFYFKTVALRDLLESMIHDKKAVKRTSSIYYSTPYIRRMLSGLKGYSLYDTPVNSKFSGRLIEAKEGTMVKAQQHNINRELFTKQEMWFVYFRFGEAITNKFGETIFDKTHYVITPSKHIFDYIIDNITSPEVLVIDFGKKDFWLENVVGHRKEVD